MAVSAIHRQSDPINLKKKEFCENFKTNNYCCQTSVMAVRSIPHFKRYSDNNSFTLTTMRVENKRRNEKLTVFDCLTANVRNSLAVARPSNKE